MSQCPYPYNISKPKPASCPNPNNHRRLALARSWLKRTGNRHLSIAVWTDGLSLCRVCLKEFGDFLETFSKRITELEASGRQFSSFIPCLPNLISLAFSFPDTWIECIKTKFPSLRSLNYGASSLRLRYYATDNCILFPKPCTLAAPWNQLTTLVTGPAVYVFWETILTSCPNLESLVFHFSKELNSDQPCSIDTHMVHLVNLTVIAPELHFVRLFNGIHTPALRTLRLGGDLLFPHPVVGLSSQQHFHDQICGIRRLSILNSHHEHIDVIASTIFCHADHVEELDLSATLEGRITRRI